MDPGSTAASSGSELSTDFMQHICFCLLPLSSPSQASCSTQNPPASELDTAQQELQFACKKLCSKAILLIQIEPLMAIRHGHAPSRAMTLSLSLQARN